jgi:hypothetical protein
MEYDQIIRNFLRDAAAQNAEALKSYFHTDAYVRWNNTNEQFTADEYIKANCEYPGSWQGDVERIVQTENLCISVFRLYSKDTGASFHATSFFEFNNGKITVLNEYFGDDGDAPKWRQEMHIGSPIRGT